jgi:nucleotide-binding universal stress UspA family protein
MGTFLPDARRRTDMACEREEPGTSHRTDGGTAVVGQEDDTLSVSTVLVPVDGSDASLAAGEHAAAVAARYDATVHALYVYDTDRSRAIESGTADEEAMAADAQSALERVTETCAAVGVAVSSSTALGFSANRLTRHPGSVVLDVADTADAGFLVVPRERDADTETDVPGVLAKTAEYVVAYASQPVLSV